MKPFLILLLLALAACSNETSAGPAMPGIIAKTEITCTGTSGETQTWRTSGPTSKDDQGRTTFTDETGAHIVVAGNCRPKA